MPVSIYNKPKTHHTHAILFHSGPETLTRDLSSTEVPLYVSLGTDGSWYRCFKPKGNKSGEPNAIGMIACFPKSTLHY